MRINEDWCPLLSVMDNIWITCHAPQPPLIVNISSLTKLLVILGILEYIILVICFAVGIEIEEKEDNNEEENNIDIFSV